MYLKVFHFVLPFCFCLKGEGHSERDPNKRTQLSGEGSELHIERVLMVEGVFMNALLRFADELEFLADPEAQVSKLRRILARSVALNEFGVWHRGPFIAQVVQRVQQPSLDGFHPF